MARRGELALHSQVRYAIRVEKVEVRLERHMLPVNRARGRGVHPAGDVRSAKQMATRCLNGILAHILADRAE